MKASGSVNPEVFISWSGRESYDLAVVVRDWLPTVLPGAKPWMSSRDIAKGKRWGAELGDSLERTSYCIVCVTPGVVREPWINFEAGAVSKIVQESYVSPLLCDVSVDDLGGLPLSMFQCTMFSMEDVRHLLESINDATGLRIPRERIHTNLEFSWAQVSQRVNAVCVSENNDLHSQEGDGSEGAAVTDVALDQSAEGILMVVAANDDHPMDVEEVTCEVHHSRVRTRHYLDQLVEAGYLSKHDQYESYGLTEDGRGYVVNRGLDLLPF